MSNQAQAVYEIRVQGHLDDGWQPWLDGLAVAAPAAGEPVAVTTLTGPIADQAALRGLLCKLWDLNLTVVLVRRVEEGSGGVGK